jgi:hypothetical protein
MPWWQLSGLNDPNSAANYRAFGGQAEKSDDRKGDNLHLWSPI